MAQYRVTNWQNASLASLVGFLERKASSREFPNLRILEHREDRDGSVVIKVPANVAQRFAHLNGFSFAGAKLGVQEIAGVASSTPSAHADPGRPQTSIPIQAARFRDEGDIGAKFVTTFFPQYDSNRQLVLQHFYDSNSSFSISVNTRANRIETAEKLDHSWSSYIKRSRNLTKITHLPARLARAHRGQEAIFKEWASLPATRHPPFDSNSSQNWLIECHSMPGLPDPSGAAPGGVGGLIVIVHGSFEELGTGGAQVTGRRSFDRTFILGPGGGLGGIRVISDVLSLRAYGGHEGVAAITEPSPLAPPQQPPPQPQPPQAPSLFQQQQQPTPLLQPTPLQTPPPAPPAPAHPEVPAGSGFGTPQPGKTDTMLSHELMTLQLSFQTRMKLQWAAEALEKNGWDLDAAVGDVQKLAGQIPADAFLQV